MHDSHLQGLKNIHILLIDDYAQDHIDLVKALRAKGGRVTATESPRKGLHFTQVLNPDLILLDVHMPDMDGFTFCRLLREMSACQDIPVIFLTSAADVTDRVTGLTVGAVDYVLKPYAIDEVLARIVIHLHDKASNAPYMQVQCVENEQSPDQVILQAATRLIRRRLNELPKLTDIAAQVGTHDKRLSAIFRQHLGMTVFAWVREERLRKAQELLADSNMSIEDISSQVGFSSAANFATAFRERFSVTPTSFRKAKETD